MTSSAQIRLEVELDELQPLDINSIRARWRRRFKSDPPKLRSKDLLLHAFAYALQAKRHGDLSPRVRRQIEALAVDFVNSASAVAKPRESLSLGAALVREWNGARHVVLVEENGFRYDGALYKSLTAAAGAITGSHWNGRRFFKLDRSREADR